MGAREIHFHKAVHAYKRGSHVYFLNSANGAWVAMPSSYAKCLMEEQDIVNHSKEYMYAYDTLANASIIQDVQHAEKQSICEHKPLIVQFQTTGECNLQCIYCFNEPSLRTHVMSETIMKQSVDYVYSHPQACYGVHFSIYGGEPLMQRDLIVLFNLDILNLKHVLNAYGIDTAVADAQEQVPVTKMIICRSMK